MFKVISDMIWWLKYRFVKKHQYHIVRLGTRPGYSDIVERLIHANFQLLREFVEEEKPFEIIDWSYRPGVEKEIKELYNWYMNERPKRKLPIHETEGPKMAFVPTENGNSKLEWVGTPEVMEVWHKACEESTRLEEFWTKQDNENIKRLADIRPYLWT